MVKDNTGGRENHRDAHTRSEGSHVSIELLTTCPTTHPNQPLLTMDAGKDATIVTVPMLVQGLKIMLDTLNMDTKHFYSLHSLRRRGGYCHLRGWSRSDGHQTAWHLGLGHFLVLHDIAVCATTHGASAIASTMAHMD